MRPKIVDVRIVQTHERVWPEITEEEALRSQLVDQTIRRMDLAFCTSNVSGTTAEYFRASVPVSVNAVKFVTEWDPHSVVMTTDFFHQEACEHINASPEYNPHIRKQG